jgi:hypothetical protein
MGQIAFRKNHHFDDSDTRFACRLESVEKLFGQKTSRQEK